MIKKYVVSFCSRGILYRTTVAQPRVTVESYKSAVNEDQVIRVATEKNCFVVSGELLAKPFSRGTTGK